MRVPVVFACWLFFFGAFTGLRTTAETDPDALPKQLPIPGMILEIDGHVAFLIPGATNETNASKPWVWYAPTLPAYPAREEQWMFQQFRAAGISIAGIDVGESYGSPAGSKLFTALHSEMVSRGYSSKPVLLGRSRGGLMLLSWAANHPDKLAGFAGIYPVCNLASYPGVANAASAFGMTAGQLQENLPLYNPVDRLAPLAKARVPLFAIHGDVDAIVPLEANSGLLADRYTALGGSMELVVPPGQGHNMWAGFFQSEQLVDFVKTQVEPGLKIASPVDYQVIQRSSKRTGTIPVSGRYNDNSGSQISVEARLVIDGRAGKWERMDMDPATRSFNGHLRAPAGGWHQVEIRVRRRDETLAATSVAHVAIGEIFIVAGQSNSANHGEERQATKTGLVSSFDGYHWRLANDPQPGASGNGGSFMPPFGDAIAEKFRVPVGIVACGVGASSVREWLPPAASISNPPTLIGNVQQLPNGEWISRGNLYNAFTRRMRALGPRGFRAVLWHQGESDANQADPARTLSGRHYREYLASLIRSTRRAVGWEAPWFVAQATYHVPGDESSPEIRAAQASLWSNAIALQGPDTDTLKGDLRENGGQGVHFSGPGLRKHAALWVEKVGAWLEEELK